MTYLNELVALVHHALTRVWQVLWGNKTPETEPQTCIAPKPKTDRNNNEAYMAYSRFLVYYEAEVNSASAKRHEEHREKEWHEDVLDKTGLRPIPAEEALCLLLQELYEELLDENQRHWGVPIEDWWDGVRRYRHWGVPEGMASYAVHNRFTHLYKIEDLEFQSFWDGASNFKVVPFYRALFRLVTEIARNPRWQYPHTSLPNVFPHEYDTSKGEVEGTQWEVKGTQ